MLFLVFGSSAAGKTAVLPEIDLPGLAKHDFDEIGVPARADLRWRQAANETWIRRGLEYQAAGIDLLLAGQTPFGELLASPSAPLLEGISGCLLDCDDESRLDRLQRRGGEWLERTGADFQTYLKWADWMRSHAADPQWMQEVIRNDASAPELCWERWVDWRAGDPRWRVQVIDTSERSIHEVAGALSAWIENERAQSR